MDDAIKRERDDDAYDFTPPPGPTPSDRRRRLAQEGNVEALLGEIRVKPWSSTPIDEMFKHILAACETRARKDPEGFSRMLFSEMIALNGFLLLRTQVYIIDRVVGRGPFACKPAMTDFSSDVAERLLPRLSEMQRGLAEILVAEAQAVRLWGLAKAKAAQTARAAGREESEAADAKAEGPRDGMAPPPARSHGRG